MSFDSTNRSESLVTQPIAIIGAECRLPGADGTSQFWELLSAGRDATGPMPASRLDRDLFFDSRRGQVGKTYSDVGGVIGDKPIDLRLLGLTQDEAAEWDECHLHLAEVVTRAMAEAGIYRSQFANRTLGIYVGHSGGSRSSGDLVASVQAAQVVDQLLKTEAFAEQSPEFRKQFQRQAIERLREGKPFRNEEGGPYLEASSAAHLIGKVLGVHEGPRQVIDAACASSLVALGMAAIALQQGRIDTAIVGGASYNKSDSMILFSNAQSCSPTGTCPFDERADGLVSSEGYIALILRPLAKAIESEERILGVIRGLGMASDGKGKSLWAPRREGQMAAIQRAYHREIGIDEVQFVEAHATSTQVGDATEVGALEACFSSRPPRSVPIGSVKSNIGHTLETAGVAGMLKTLLGMQHETIPPTANLQKLNPTIDWEKSPFHIPTSPIPWRKPADRPRCGAVNAFGIGGINVHVVLEQYDETYHRKVASHQRPRGTSVGISTANSSGGFQADDLRRSAHPEPAESIAIVGRGVVLPSAHDLSQWQALLASSRPAIGPPPESRHDLIDPEYLSSIGLASELTHGGYLQDYQFDWKQHKIPPKQIALGNPLQFMLLDAAGQALSECQQAGTIDASKTAVMVGTVFGGAFGNSLQVGLRLQEIRRSLSDILQPTGISQSQLETCLAEFQQRLLESFPALLDETGSFTSSTLASRITKHFHLMGGALAMDCAEHSSAHVLASATDLLRSGGCNMVLCAAGQYGMDLSTLHMLQKRRLLSPAKPQAEGVAVLALKRVSRAEADGNTILGLLPEKLEPESIRHLEQRIASQIGDLGAGRGLLSVLTSTLTDSTAPNERTQIPSQQPPQVSSRSHAQPSGASMGGPTMTGGKRWSLNANTLDELHSIVRGLEWEALADNANYTAQSWLVCGYATEIKHWQKQKHDLLASQEFSDLLALASKGCFVRNREMQTGRSIVFLFPGQGSQDARQFDDFGQDREANEILERVNHALRNDLQSRSVTELLKDATSQSQPDPWAVQSTMFVADMLYANLVAEQGFRPHMVAGHSLGEIAAYCATGAIDLLSTLSFLKVRSDSVAQMQNRATGLMSIRATSQSVRDMLGRTTLPLTVTHQNAPQQTVVGGYRDALHEFGELCSAQKIAHTILNVPAAFHAPVMAETQPAIAEVARGLRMRPSETPILSTVSNRYQCDPADFRRNLVDQMVTPVDFVSTIERLYDDGGRIFVEIGPGSVASALASQSLTQRDAIFYSLGSSTSLERKRQEIALLRDMFQVRVEPSLGVRAVDGISSKSQNRKHRQDSGILQNQLLQPIDSERGLPASGMPMSFDATQRRKSRIRKDHGPLNRDPGTARKPGTAQKPGTSQTPSKPTESFTTADHFDDFDSQSIAAREAHGDVERSSGLGSSGVMPQTPEKPHSSFEHSQVETNASKSAGQHAGGDPLESFLKEFIVDHTGYPSDMIQNDWDFESDLGIDSIKQAQLFGELREMFDFDPRELQDGKVRTIEQMIAFFSSKPGKGEWLSVANHAPSQLESPSASASIPKDALPDSENSKLPPQTRRVAEAGTTEANNVDETANHSELKSFVTEFVIDQTGYPPELIDFNADFEADLGLDSIKLAQLTGELRSHFGLQLNQQTKEQMGQIRTLQQIVDLLCPNRKEHESDAAPPGGSPDSGSGNTSANPHSAFATNGPHEQVAGAKANSSERSVVGLLADAPEFALAKQLATEESSRLLGYVNAAVDELGYLGAGRPTKQPIAFNAQSDAAVVAGVAEGLGIPVESLHSFRDHSRDIQNWIDDKQFLFANARPELGQGSFASGAIVTHVADAAPSSESNYSDMPPLDRLPIENAEDISHRFRVTAGQVGDGHAIRHPQPLIGRTAIVGKNRVARSLAEKLTAAGFEIVAIEDFADMQSATDILIGGGLVQNMILANAFDAEAKSSAIFESNSTTDGRSLALFECCQSWYRRLVECNAVGDATFIGLTAMGGKFGFGSPIYSAESGMVSGLTKALSVEWWVSGFRSATAKIVDFDPASSVGRIVDRAIHACTHTFPHGELGHVGNEEFSIQMTHQPLAASEMESGPRPSGNWLYIGGARGITAATALEIAKRYGTISHLVGTTPLHDIPPEWLEVPSAELSAIRKSVMQDARAKNENALQAWQRTEKVLQIRKTLRSFEREGCQAHYYHCDVSDVAEVQKLVDSIRESHGQITGCIQGAGVGQDARFDKKLSSKVKACLDSKIAGSYAVLSALREQPLTHLIGFGSISGRFGANGNTDYAAANECLAKILGWYRQENPRLRATTFHWHAWDDVGMAMKPDTRLGLEMVQMQFMPSREGVLHVLREIDAGLPDPEVLVTDFRYYNMFHPPETRDLFVTARTPSSATPRVYALLDEDSSETPTESRDESIFPCRVDPIRHPFLREHTLDKKPLLPLVAGIELMAEASLAAIYRDDPTPDAHQGTLIENLLAKRALRFFNDAPKDLRVVARSSERGINASLQSDFYSRDGKLIDRDRIHMTASIRKTPTRSLLNWKRETSEALQFDWQKASYPGKEKLFYVGREFQVLTHFHLLPGRGFGLIRTPAKSELAGNDCDVLGWLTPSAVIDACLFCTGILNWEQVRPSVALPVGIKKLMLHREPMPNQVLFLETRLKTSNKQNCWFDFCLWSNRDEIVLEAIDYQTAWVT